MHYTQAHTILSTLISLATALTLHFLYGYPTTTWWLWIWGGVFYGMREFWQSARGGFVGFDKPGFISGVAPSALIALILYTM